MDDIISDSQKISRNAPCPCGSGKKFKKCCGASAVAAERAAEERRNPNWAPEGVTATEDDTKGAWVCPHPKWITRIAIMKDGTAEKDAERVLNGVFRPYFERFCADVLKEEEIVILQNSQMQGEKTFVQCPSMVMVRSCEIMAVYKKKLIEFFKYFSDTDYYDCEVRYDQSCGGPILTLTNAEGDIEIFFIGMLDRYAVRA